VVCSAMSRWRRIACDLHFYSSVGEVCMCDREPAVIRCCDIMLTPGGAHCGWEAWLEITSMVLHDQSLAPHVPQITTDDEHLAMIELTES